jgi:hypothetical protein
MFELLTINSRDIEKRSAEIKFYLTEIKKIKEEVLKCAAPGCLFVRLCCPAEANS